MTLNPCVSNMLAIDYYHFGILSPTAGDVYVHYTILLKDAVFIYNIKLEYFLVAS